MISKELRIKNMVHGIVGLLVQGEYDALESLSQGHRLAATEISEAVRSYCRNLIMPPDSSFNNLDIVEIDGAEPKEWDVNVDLWTVEEGRSDLTLELRLKEIGEEKYSVEIDNIHVL
jgi:hypothetical protein